MQAHCQANAPREIVLKNLPTIKKIKNADTRADRKEESKMTMTQKLNKDNVLQDLKTEHQAVTRCIFYCRVSANMKGYGSLQTSSWLDSDVLRNRQPKHTAIR